VECTESNWYLFLGELQSRSPGTEGVQTYRGGGQDAKCTELRDGGKKTRDPKKGSQTKGHDRLPRAGKNGKLKGAGGRGEFMGGRKLGGWGRQKGEDQSSRFRIRIQLKKRKWKTEERKKRGRANRGLKKARSRTRKNRGKSTPAEVDQHLVVGKKSQRGRTFLAAKKGKTSLCSRKRRFDATREKRG